MRRTAACLVCGGTCSLSNLPGLLRCSICGFVTADLEMSHHALEALYGASYFAGEEYKDYVSERRLIEKNFRGRLRTLLKYVPRTSEKRLFEIGSAYGFFLSVAQGHFASVEGIDISRDAAVYAAERLKLPVYAGDFLYHPIQGKIDVACLWDTIEHLQAPDLYIEKLAAHMDRGGVIAITTGDVDSFVARIRGAKWRQIHPPTHLHYFSQRTLMQLLRRYGFRLRHRSYDGAYRSLDTMAHVIFKIKHDWSAVYQCLKNARLLNWDMYLNLYDIVFVVAEKE